MAGAATVSPFIHLTCTNLPGSPSRNHSFPQSTILHNNNNHTRIIIIQNAKLNGSRGEEVKLEEEIDEAFCYSSSDVIEDEEESDEEDEDDTESSVDLLFRFVQSLFRKVSKRVRKASSSVLPAIIPPHLVSFAVDGVLLLASLSILKALLEVACTIGGTVFVVILLVRVIWAAIFYFQSSGNNFNQSGTSYSRTQPVT